MAESSTSRHPGQALMIDLGAGVPGTCLGLSLQDGDGQTSDSVCNEEFATAIGVQRTQYGRVAGASTWKGENGEHVTFMFNLPMQK